MRYLATGLLARRRRLRPPQPCRRRRRAPTAPEVLLVVLNKGAASASLVDPADGTTVATLPTGDGPHEIAVSPDGRRAIVTNYGGERPGSSLTVLHLAGRVAGRTIDLAPLRRPHGVAWLPDGRHVVVTIETDSLVAIVDVDSGAVVGRIPTRQGGSHMVALSPDGAFAYVANIGSGSVSMLDVAGRYLVRTAATGAGAEGIAVSPNGAELWVTNRAANTVSVLDAATLAPLDTLASPTSRSARLSRAAKSRRHERALGIAARLRRARARHDRHARPPDRLDAHARHHARPGVRARHRRADRRARLARRAAGVRRERERRPRDGRGPRRSPGRRLPADGARAGGWRADRAIR